MQTNVDADQMQNAASDADQNSLSACLLRDYWVQNSYKQIVAIVNLILCLKCIFCYSSWAIPKLTMADT